MCICFDMQGGLPALANLLAHSNIHVRGQAIDCFMAVRGAPLCNCKPRSQHVAHGGAHLHRFVRTRLSQITSHDDLAWFDPPTKETEDLHNQLLSLVMFEDFPDSYTTR